MTTPQAPGRALALAPWVLAAVGLALLVGYGIVSYPSMPSQLPTHFDGSGQADAWRDKSYAIVFGPLLIGIAIVAGIAVLTAVLPAILRAPKDASEWSHFRTSVLRRAATAMLGMIMTAVVGLFGYISLVTWSGQSHISMWPVVAFVLLVFASLWPLTRVTPWAERAAGPAGVRRTAEDIADDARWTPTGMYRGQADDPLLVPKRPGYGIGGTLNVNHPSAKFLLFGLALVMAAPLALIFVL